MNNKKTCVISYADGLYTNGLKRLELSIKKHSPSCDILFWYNELPPNSPTHNEVPCGFKIYAFLEAKRKGYTKVLWIDATGAIINNLEPIFNQIERDGYYIPSPFCSSIGFWSSDATLEKAGISREKAFLIPEALTFAIGIDFESEIGNKFITEYLKKAEDGISFRGAPLETSIVDTLKNTKGSISKDETVLGHRWEQTVASIITDSLNMKFSLYWTYDLIAHSKKNGSYAACIPNSTIIVQNRDIKSENYIQDIDVYYAKSGLSRVIYTLQSILLGLLRPVKNYVRVISKTPFNLERISFVSNETLDNTLHILAKLIRGIIKKYDKKI